MTIRLEDIHCLSESKSTYIDQPFCLCGNNQLLSEIDGCVSKDECSCREKGQVFNPGDISETKLADPCEKDCKCIDGSIRCKQAECVKCVFSEWSIWSKCDRTCGMGSKIRFQMNLTPSKKCDISRSQVQDCNMQPCDGSTSLGWSAWGTCSRSCGGGSRSRYYFGKEKIDSNIESEICGTEKCPDEWFSNWSDWSRCSRSCGGDGKMSRMRDCLKDDGQCLGWLTEEKTCRTPNCIEEHGTCPNGTEYQKR